MLCTITGGMGFIGSALARRLLALGHEVRIIDNLSPQIHGDAPDGVPPAGARLIRGDVRDLAAHPQWIDGSDAVFHLAAETGTAQSMYRIAHYVSVNEGGTAALLEAIAGCARRPRRLVLASSRSIYGEGAYRDVAGALVQPGPRSRAMLEQGVWEPLDARGRGLTPVATPEDLPLQPGSVYAATKAAQELLVRSACPALGLSCAVLRFQNVYGEGQSLQNPYTGIISIFYNRARQGLPLPIYEDGRETRDFVHVDDVVEALVASLDPSLPETLTCNVGSGEGTSVAALADALVAASGFAVPVVVTGEFRLGDIRHNRADLSRARDLLGYAPRIGLAAGLARFCRWAGAQEPHEDRLDQATAELVARGLAHRAKADLATAAV